MTLSNWQLAWKGLTMGEGTRYVIQSVTGLGDAPEIRTGDSVRARANGLFRGEDLEGGRTIAVKVDVDGVHPNEAVWDAFQRVMVGGGATESPLSFKVPGIAGGGERFVNARMRRKSNPSDAVYASGIGRVEIEFYATDPLIYSTTATTLTTTQATTSGGFTFPLTFPLTFGSATSGGLMAANNEGSFATPWTATITGPVVNPRITNQTTSSTLTFNGTLAAGETLVVDSATRTVLLSGTASRYSWLAQGSKWFDLVAGTNTIQFSGASGSGSISLTFRSAWT